MTGLQLALPTAGDRTVGGIKSVWITPRRWVARWIHERSTQGGYGQVVGAEYGRRGWSILTRNPVEGTLSYRQRAVSGGAFAYECTLNLTINGYSLERRDWLEALTQGSDVAMMVQLVDGVILLMGEERGCRLTCDFDSGQRGRGAKITLNATHTTRAPLRTVPLDVAQRWVVPSLCEDTTMAAFCRLTMDDLCAAVPAEVCPPVGPGGATLAIQLIPGPPGPEGPQGPQGVPGTPAPAPTFELVRLSDSSVTELTLTEIGGRLCLDPSTLPDWFVLVWYKPRALSTPGAVTSFVDLSGNGYDISAPAAINEPVLTAYAYSYGTRYGAFYTTDDEMATAILTVPYSSDVEVLWMGLPDPVNNSPGGDYNYQPAGITRYSTRSAAVSNLLRFQTGRGASTGSPFSTSLLAITQNDSTSAATAVLWPPLLTRSRYKFGGSSLATFLISSTTKYGDTVQHEAVTTSSFVPQANGQFRLFSRAAGTNYGRGILFEILALDHAAAANDTSPLGQYIENWYRYAEDDTTRIHLF